MITNNVTLFTLQLVADFADTHSAHHRESSVTTNKFLFGTLIFLLRDYQASSNFGEDSGYFSAVVSV